MSDENLEVLSIEAANYSSGMFLEQYHLLNQICGKSRFISTFIGIFHIDKYIFLPFMSKTLAITLVFSFKYFFGSTIFSEHIFMSLTNPSVPYQTFVKLI